jgi:hypothetical protein
MNDPALHARKRRWWQFRLRTLLIVVTLLCVGLLVWRTYVRPYRLQQEVMQRLANIGASYQTQTGGSALLRRPFGDEFFQDVIEIDVRDSDDPEVSLDDVQQLPRLAALAVGGPQFGDEHLRRLAGIRSLRVLVLDSTSVSDPAVAELKTKVPALAVHRSDSCAMAIFRQRGGTVVAHESGGPIPEFSLLGAEDRRRAKRVDLSGVYFDDELLQLVTALRRVETLHLGFNVSDDAAAALGKLSNLRHLYLENTQITDTGVSALTSFPRLRLLSLGRNVTNDGLVHITALKSLVYVDLASTQVTDDGLSHLASLPNLTKLNLSGRPITDAGLRQLRQLPALEELHLRWCTDLTDAGVSCVREFGRLRMLDIHGVNVSPACLKELREFVPESRH